MADRHNACINPCLTVDNTGWGGNGTTPVRTTVTGFGRTQAARYTSGTFIRTPYGVAAAGNTYTISLFVRFAANVSGGTIYFEWQDASHGALSYSSTGFVAAADTVTRISVSGTAPSSTAFIAIIVDGANFGDNTLDATMVLIEQVADLGTYFDGDTANATWDGASGNSASTLSLGGPVAGDVSQAVTGGVTVGGANAAVGAASQSVVAAVTAAGVNAAVAAVSVPATASVVAVAAVSGPSGGGSGGWYSLLDIAREAALERRAERERGPVACPNDGEPLRAGPDGELHCTFDGFIYQG